MDMTFQVPDHTSINKKEFTPDEYAIAFAPELVGFILQDRKLTTYRYGDKYGYLKVGDEISIQNSSTGEIKAKARIINKMKTTFGELPIQIGTHEAYRDKEHQREVLSGYYAYLGRPLVDEDSFLVFDFELVSK